MCGDVLGNRGGSPGASERKASGDRAFRKAEARPPVSLDAQRRGNEEGRRKGHVGAAQRRAGPGLTPPHRHSLSKTKGLAGPRFGLGRCRAALGSRGNCLSPTRTDGTMTGVRQRGRKRPGLGPRPGPVRIFSACSCLTVSSHSRSCWRNSSSASSKRR